MECLICGGKKPKLIQSTRIQSFHEASKQRGDGLSEKLPKDELHFTCHKNCISTYCSKHHIEWYLRKRKADIVHVMLLKVPKNCEDTVVLIFFMIVCSVVRNA